ncbi:MAG: ATP-binding protein, partial [Dongiaceae bacterium]
CNGIITDLLEFTRVRDLNRQVSPIDAWLAELLDEHELPAGVELRREMSCGSDVALDKDRFRQVLVNLLDNAAQAMLDSSWEPGADRPRRITVRTEIAGPHVRLSVLDTGPGIAPDLRAKIFEPLFTTKNFGVGLGLPTVRQIVEQHGGTIEVDSAPERGTEFVIWLPRQVAAAQGEPPALRVSAA